MASKADQVLYSGVRRIVHSLSSKVRDLVSLEKKANWIETSVDHVSKSKPWLQLDLNQGQHNHNITYKVLH